MKKKEVMEKYIDLQERHKILNVNYKDVLNHWNQCKKDLRAAHKELDNMAKAEQN
jgi:hypothetical protein